MTTVSDIGFVRSDGKEIPRATVTLIQLVRLDRLLFRLHYFGAGASAPLLLGFGYRK